VCSVARNGSRVGICRSISLGGGAVLLSSLAQRISDGRGSTDEGADFAYQVFQAAGICSPIPVCLTQGETGSRFL
jgi:hypothetical protein